VDGEVWGVNCTWNIPRTNHCIVVTTGPGVAGLQPAFHINRLLEIGKSRQKKLKNSAATPERGAMTNAPSRDAVRHCFEHPEKECELYCETCGVLRYMCVHVITEA